MGLLLRGAPSMTPYSTSPNRHMGSSRVEWQIVREVVTKFSISSKCGARVLGEVSAGMPPPKTWGFLWSNFPNFFPQKISHREGPNENPSFKETVPHVWNACLLVGCFPRHQGLLWWDEKWCLKQVSFFSRPSICFNVNHSDLSKPRYYSSPIFFSSCDQKIRAAEFCVMVVSPELITIILGRFGQLLPKTFLGQK